MKLVIDISDNEYNTILENAEYYKKQNWGSANVWDAIKNGVPLPKGHGDLIDLSELQNYIYDVPRVIPADEGE